MESEAIELLIADLPVADDILVSAFTNGNGIWQHVFDMLHDDWANMFREDLQAIFSLGGFGERFQGKRMSLSPDKLEKIRDGLVLKRAAGVVSVAVEVVFEKDINFINQKHLRPIRIGFGCL